MAEGNLQCKQSFLNVQRSVVIKGGFNPNYALSSTYFYHFLVSIFYDIGLLGKITYSTSTNSQDRCVGKSLTPNIEFSS